MSSGWFQRERFQRAIKFHLCAQGHLIRPGDTYCVGVDLPGSGAYRTSPDDWETIDWDFGWSKICTPCYDAYMVGETPPPPTFRFASVELRRAFEAALKNGHQPEPDPSGMAIAEITAESISRIEAHRFTCFRQGCGQAFLQPGGRGAPLYGSLSQGDKCLGTNQPRTGSIYA